MIRADTLFVLLYPLLFKITGVLLHTSIAALASADTTRQRLHLVHSTQCSSSAAALASADPFVILRRSSHTPAPWKHGRHRILIRRAARCDSSGSDEGAT